jgi:hypothetical protein
MTFEILNKNPQTVSHDLIQAIEAVLKNGEPEFEQEYRLGVAANEKSAVISAPTNSFNISSPDFNA